MLTFPIASSPLSKKKMIPRNEKKTPNPVKPRPISVSSNQNKNRFLINHLEISLYSDELKALHQLI